MFINQTFSNKFSLSIWDTKSEAKEEAEDDEEEEEEWFVIFPQNGDPDE
mgnify:CR=1 FL=1